MCLLIFKLSTFNQVCKCAKTNKLTGNILKNDISADYKKKKSFMKILY